MQSVDKISTEALAHVNETRTIFIPEKQFPFEHEQYQLLKS